MEIRSVLIGVSNKKGSIILQSLIGAGVILVFIVSVIAYLNSSLKDGTNSLYKQRLELINARIIAAIEHNTAWKETQAQASNVATFSCLQNNSCPDSWTYINLVSAGGSQLVGIGGTAFNLAGEECMTFSATAASDTCPFLYKVKWKPDCTACTQSIEVATELSISPVKGVTLNPENYMVNFIRGKIEGTLEGQCSAMGGQLDPGNKANCILPITSAAECVPGTFLNGTDANGFRVCTAIQGTFETCPNGMATIRADGSLGCN